MEPDYVPAGGAETGCIMAEPSPHEADFDRTTRRWTGVAFGIARKLVGVPLWLGVAGLTIAIALAYAVPVRWVEPSLLAKATNLLIFFVRVFQYHIALTLLGAAVLGLLIGRWRVAGLAGVAAAALVGLELWRAMPEVTRPEPTGPTLRVASLNLYFKNSDVAAIDQYLRDLDADVVTFSEYSALHRPLSDGLRDLYPHQLIPVTNRLGRGGFGFLSKVPMEQRRRWTNSDRVTIDFDGGSLDVTAVHLASPGSLRAVGWNYRGLDQLVLDYRQTRAEGRESIIGGDFNASPWTPQLARLRRIGLTEAFDAAGLGRGDTWPSRHHRVPGSDHIHRLSLGLRIDHQFYSDGLVAIDTGVGPHVGSDHRPVWADYRRVD